jgi:predicted SnoaL-like aldol condensation-catalyzing enzyme
MEGKTRMNKKEIARLFLKNASAGKVREAFDEYVHLNFRHHLVYFKGDRESLMEAMEENCRQFPKKTYNTIHLVEDGDLVAVHGKVEVGPKVYGVIHIFRFKGDKIIELWEASQEELKDSPNEYGLF